MGAVEAPHRDEGGGAGTHGLTSSRLNTSKSSVCDTCAAICLDLSSIHGYPVAQASVCNSSAHRSALPLLPRSAAVSLVRPWVEMHEHKHPLGPLCRRVQWIASSWSGLCADVSASCNGTLCALLLRTCAGCAGGGLW